MWIPARIIVDPIDSFIYVGTRRYPVDPNDATTGKNGILVYWDPSPRQGLRENRPLSRPWTENRWWAPAVHECAAPRPACCGFPSGPPAGSGSDERACIASQQIGAVLDRLGRNQVLRWSAVWAPDCRRAGADRRQLSGGRARQYQVTARPGHLQVTTD